MFGRFEKNLLRRFFRKFGLLNLSNFLNSILGAFDFVSGEKFFFFDGVGFTDMTELGLTVWVLCVILEENLFLDPKPDLEGLNFDGLDSEDSLFELMESLILLVFLLKLGLCLVGLFLLRLPNPVVDRPDFSSTSSSTCSSKTSSDSSDLPLDLDLVLDTLDLNLLAVGRCVCESSSS